MIDLDNNVNSFNIDLIEFSSLIWSYNFFKFDQKTEG